MKYGMIHQAGNSAVSGALWQGNGRTTTPQPHNIAINPIAPIFYTRTINDYCEFS